MSPCTGTVGVLTDRPPGNPPRTIQTQDAANTVDPVPMTFGREPNTFQHSAAHVLSTNNNPSSSEGVTMYEIYASAARHIELHVISTIQWRTEF